MPVAHSVEPDGCILLRGWGQLDYETARSDLRDIGRARHFGRGCRLFVDFREVERFDVEASDLVSLIDESSQFDDMLEGSSVAVVASDDIVYGMMRMYQQLASEAPVQVEVFRDADEAHRWLHEVAA